MSDDRASGASSRFCTKCGRQVKADASFCVSCGASLTRPIQETPDVRSVPSGPSFPEKIGHTAASVMETFLRLKARLSVSSENTSGNTWKGTTGRLLTWFRDLPAVPKFTLLGLLVVALLIALSPVVRIVAILLFGVSLIALIVQVIRRRSIRTWSVITGTSLVLIPLFSLVSGVLYGSETTPDYSDSEPSGTDSSLIAGVQEGDASFQAYELCHSYFLDELATEFGTDEDHEDVAYVVGDQIGTTQKTKQAAYDGCFTALEEEAVNYLPATEDNIIQLVMEGGTGEPPDESWNGTFYVSEDVDMSEVPATDIYNKPTDMNPDHWFLVEYCSPQGSLDTNVANPWTADTYQVSFEFGTSGGSAC